MSFRSVAGASLATAPLGKRIHPPYPLLAAGRIYFLCAAGVVAWWRGWRESCFGYARERLHRKMRYYMQ